MARDEYDATDEELRVAEQISKKYNTKAEDLELLTMVLVQLGFQYDKRTINLLKAQIEIMEYIDISCAKDGKTRL